MQAAAHSQIPYEQVNPNTGEIQSQCFGNTEKPVTSSLRLTISKVHRPNSFIYSINLPRQGKKQRANLSPGQY